MKNIQKQLVVLALLVVPSSPSMSMYSHKNGTTQTTHFIIPSVKPKLRALMHNQWYTQIETEDENVRSFERSIPLGLDTEVIQVSFDTKGKLLNCSIEYRTPDFKNNESKVAWKITKNSVKKSFKCHCAKPAFFVMALVCLCYALCKGPFYTQEPLA
ncbi:hypothetical protein H0X48_02020 [Candidatus Dependentiae bacterium]|nr:hypothetical protein [Candidatus Dependentiae bacterium]